MLVKKTTDKNIISKSLKGGETGYWELHAEYWYINGPIFSMHVDVEQFSLQNIVPKVCNQYSCSNHIKLQIEKV